MIASAALAKRALGMFGRVFPRCGTIAQAVAFNLFLAFFPGLLVVVGLATSRVGGRTNLLGLITDFAGFLPPGSQQIVSEFLVNRGPQAWKWALVGLAGTLLAGSQVMRLLMEGIQVIYQDHERVGFLHRQVRGIALLLVTIAPLLAASILGVFGKPLRGWVAHEFAKHEFARNDSVQTLWALFLHGTAIFLVMISLTVIYRVARPKETSLGNVLPGAMIATLLWWAADVAFGFYVRKVPYGIVYGGLAAVIGLMIWMQLSTVIIFLGAAWNAELEDTRKGSRSRG
jgi:membrane protein